MSELQVLLDRIREEHKHESWYDEEGVDACAIDGVGWPCDAIELADAIETTTTAALVLDSVVVAVEVSRLILEEPDQLKLFNERGERIVVTWGKPTGSVLSDRYGDRPLPLYEPTFTTLATPSRERP